MTMTAALASTELPPTLRPATKQPRVRLIKLPASCCERRQQVQWLKALLISAAHFTGTTCRLDAACVKQHIITQLARPHVGRLPAPFDPPPPSRLHFLSDFHQTSSRTLAVCEFQT